MEPVTNTERKQLRKLSGVAYERELSSELAALEGRFGEWRAGGIGPHELSDAIHEFHEGASRRLFVFYTQVDPRIVVARAIAYGILKKEEVPYGIVPKLAQMIAYYRDELEAK